jgi:hypothetical protein
MEKQTRIKSDKALLGMVSGFRTGILNGGSPNFMCFAICAPLQSLLSIEGIEVALIKGWVDCGDYDMEHVWLQLEDGRVLDPTADQFPLSLPPVYLGEQPAQYNINE